MIAVFVQEEAFYSKCDSACSTLCWPCCFCQWVLS